jgi:hypothetical protein
MARLPLSDILYSLVGLTVSSVVMAVCDKQLSYSKISKNIVGAILRHFLSPSYLLCLQPTRLSAIFSGQMPKDSANRMDDSTELEHVELQQFIPIQHDVKIPTTKEARTARVQFLALCWSLFLMGWINGSTGPLLPSIQKSYDVMEPIFFSTFSVPTNYTGRV